MVPVPDHRSLRQTALLIGLVIATGCGGDKLDTGLSCPTFGAPEAAGTVAVSALDEASGLAASTLHPDVLWTHNDDGDDDGRVYAITTEGTHVATLTLSGVDPTDWETVAVTNARGTSELIVGDVGDNDADRSTVTLLITAEPGTLTDSIEAGVVERITFSLPDGPTDIEAMAVDPASGRVLLFTRSADRTDVLAVDIDSATPEPTQVASIDLNRSVFAGLGAVRGADIAPDGSVVLRLTDGAVWYSGSGSAVDALAGEPCAFEAPAEENGEGIAVSGTGIFFIGEDTDPTLWRVGRLGG